MTEIEQQLLELASKSRARARSWRTRLFISKGAVIVSAGEAVSYVITAWALDRPKLYVTAIFFVGWSFVVWRLLGPMCHRMIEGSERSAIHLEALAHAQTESAAELHYDQMDAHLNEMLHAGHPIFHRIVRWWYNRNHETSRKS